MKSVEITVKELRPELLGDYLQLFDDVYQNDPWLNTKSNPGGESATAGSTMTRVQKKNATPHQTQLLRIAR